MASFFVCYVDFKVRTSRRDVSLYQPSITSDERLDRGGEIYGLAHRMVPVMH
jgi:hypothetical protein